MDNRKLYVNVKVAMERLTPGWRRSDYEEHELEATRDRS